MTVQEDPETFHRRIAWVSAQIAASEEDCVSLHLAQVTGDDPQPHADRMYGRLEAMNSRDLALAVALMFNDRAAVEANRLWSQLWTTAPKDVKA